MEALPTMYVLAGPNGAGKSTLYEVRIKPMTAAPFINADIILKERQEAGEDIGAYRAAEIAAEQRDDCLAKGISFVTESVFSHPSKVDLIRRATKAGFRVVLYHVNVASADISVARVRFRASEGGHDVPEQKIRERYKRNQRHIRDAVNIADHAEVFDSSKARAPARWLMTFKSGHLHSTCANIPAWAKALYRI